MKNKYIQISIIVLAVFLILLLFHYKTRYVTREIEKHNEQIERTILKTVKDNFKIEGVSVLSINIGSLDTTKKEIKLSTENIENIENNIAAKISEYYKNQDSVSFNQSIPFIIFPYEKDKQNNIVLKPIDLENIKNHIKFLTEKTDEAVKDIKDELGRDIDRLNLWTSIWIGIIGIFGALLPLYIQYTTKKQTDKEFDAIKADLITKENNLTKKIDDDISTAKTDFNEIKSNADIALQSALKAEEKALKIQSDIIIHEQNFELIKKEVTIIKDGVITQNQELAKIQKDTKDAIAATEEASKLAIKATSESEIALKKSVNAENLLKFFTATGNLKRMDWHKLAYYNIPMNEYLSKTFTSIKNEFENLEPISIEDKLYKDFIQELMLSLNVIKRLIGSRANLKEFDSLIDLLKKFIVSKEEERKHIQDKIIESLTLIIDNLNKTQIQ